MAAAVRRIKAGAPHAGATQAASSVVAAVRVLMILVTSCLPLSPTSILEVCSLSHGGPWGPQVLRPLAISHPIIWKTGLAGGPISQRSLARTFGCPTTLHWSRVETPPT